MKINLVKKNHQVMKFSFRWKKLITWWKFYLFIFFLTKYRLLYIISTDCIKPCGLRAWHLDCRRNKFLKTTYLISYEEYSVRCSRIVRWGREFILVVLRGSSVVSASLWYGTFASNLKTTEGPCEDLFFYFLIFFVWFIIV